YGKPFNQIAELRPGDEIIVQTKDGFYTYTFRNFDIILPDAVEVLSPVPDEPEYNGKDRILTMTACNPTVSARERYGAYADLIAAVVLLLMQYVFPVIAPYMPFNNATVTDGGQ